MEPVDPGTGWIAAAGGADAESDEVGDVVLEDALAPAAALLEAPLEGVLVEAVSLPPDEEDGVDSRDDVSTPSAGF